MAHQVDTLANGKHSMAYVGDLPWHGLGQKLTVGASIETWIKEAQLDWELEEVPALYMDHEREDGSLRVMPGKKILIRSDNRAALAVVGADYNVLQPRDVVKFYDSLVKTGGFALETAGSLRGGRKYWALAKINQSAKILGVDEIKGYLLLATACDGSLATTAMLTSTRVVCANTLQFSIDEGESGRSQKYIKLPHAATFDPDRVKAQLGLAAGSWELFIQRVSALAKRKIAVEDANEILVTVFGGEFEDADTELEEGEWREAVEQRTAVQSILDLFKGKAKGAELKTAKSTAWGLVNATTEYLDHLRKTRTADARLERAWFGDGAVIKQKMFDECVRVTA